MAFDLSKALELEPDAPLEEELDGLDITVWEEDGYDDEMEYELDKVRFVDNALAQSRDYWTPIKERWNAAEKKLERLTSSPLSTKNADLPIVEQLIEEAVAIQVETLPTPSTSPESPEDAEASSTLNSAMRQVFKENEYEVTMAQIALDMKHFNLGVLKPSVDVTEDNPNGNPGAIVLTKIDPRYVWFDPYARGYTLKNMRYVIIAEPMDLSDIRLRWPEKGQLVEPEDTYSLLDDKEDAAHGPNEDALLYERHRALVKEMWVRDDSLKFVPDRNIDGSIKRNVDDEPMGRWEKRYPHGRMIVVANGVVLADQPNPFAHGHIPYVFFPNRITRKVLSVGDADAMLSIEDKLNKLAIKAFKNIIIQMNSPVLVENNAFRSPQQFKNLTNEEGLIIPHTPGAKIQRLSPGMLPPDVFEFMKKLQGYLDDILGLQPVLRGQLEKGAQMSSDAVQQLQVSAQARLRLKSRLMEKSLRELGYQVMWLIRQFYWGQDRRDGELKLELEVGSNLPGSKEAGKNWVLRLWDKGLITRKYAIRSLEVPGAEQELKDQDALMQQQLEAGLMPKIFGGGGKVGRKEQSPTA